jgi:hypothetical protein
LCLITPPLRAQEQPAAPDSPPTADDTARLLAGMPPAGDMVAAPTRDDRWQRHAQVLDAAWTELEERQLSKVRRWAKDHIPADGGPKGTVFYMFSGPDFLYADAFFPDATTYILCGMEPPGPLPDLGQLNPKALGGELRALRESLDTVLSFSFFRTKDMKELRDRALGGTLPIIYLFLARTGKTLTGVSQVWIDTDGTPQPRADGERLPSNAVPGARIDFLASGSPKPRTLYYFSTDISDSGLKHTGFLKFCQGLAPGASCVKSASYLMHKSYFSGIRAFLLEHSSVLVQDDSGIPCAFFTPESWQVRFFGSYPGPIPLFKEYRQHQLTEYYRTTDPVPLDFGIGYRHRVGESMLMVARRQPDPPPQPAAAVDPQETHRSRPPQAAASGAAMLPAPPHDQSCP